MNKTLNYNINNRYSDIYNNFCFSTKCFVEKVCFYGAGKLVNFTIIYN